MKFVRETSPYIRKNVSVKRMMLDVIIALIPIVLFATIQNGWNGIYVILASVLTMLIVEALAVMLIKWPQGMKRKELFSKEGFKKVLGGYTINNLTCPIISALIFSLLLPAATPVYVVIVGSIVGILFGKLVFGPYGNNIFNPAALGFIFVKLCFTSQLDSALINQTSQIFPSLVSEGTNGALVITSGTPLAQIGTNLGNFASSLQNYSLMDLFIGNVPGAMGEVCSVLILVSLLYLVVRKAIDLRSTLSMIGSFMIITFFVGIVLNMKTPTHVGNFMAYELLAGGLLFGATFMITDPVTSPVTKFGRICYGAFAGIMVALIRYIGGYPEGVAFAILLANIITCALDYFMRGKKNSYTWIQALGLVVVITCVTLIICFTVNGRIEVPQTTNFISALGGLRS